MPVMDNTTIAQALQEFYFLLLINPPVALIVLHVHVLLLLLLLRVMTAFLFWPPSKTYERQEFSDCLFIVTVDFELSVGL